MTERITPDPKLSRPDFLDRIGPTRKQLARMRQLLHHLDIGEDLYLQELRKEIAGLKALDYLSRRQASSCIRDLVEAVSVRARPPAKDTS